MINIIINEISVVYVKILINQFSKIYILKKKYKKKLLKSNININLFNN